MKEEKKHEEQIETSTQELLLQESLPNAGIVLTLGILSIPFFCCFPISLPLGIVAWVMGNKGIATYEENPEAYTRSSLGNMRAGRITAIVGIVLTVCYLCMMIYTIMQLGGWDAYMEEVRRRASQEFQMT